jgi:hypothetical protein
VVVEGLDIAFKELFSLTLSFVSVELYRKVVLIKLLLLW